MSLTASIGPSILLQLKASDEMSSNVAGVSGDLAALAATAASENFLACIISEGLLGSLG